MTDEINFSPYTNHSKLPELDGLIEVQQELIKTQKVLIEVLQSRNKSLESELSELKTAFFQG